MLKLASNAEGSEEWTSPNIRAILEAQPLNGRSPFKPILPPPQRPRSGVVDEKHPSDVCEGATSSEPVVS